ncbi:ABC transporter permease [Roseovarius arcticus]|uniref:ABC transporter permease n=1 Tax=Roseovarius arcticus TaxID=2547404 RepID=UPI001110119F|nr:ABC transporter permease [Roseovarius arcticus]
MDRLPVLVIKRLAFGVVTLFIISVIVFLGLEALPGDLAQTILGQAATEENTAALRQKLGLDLPAHVRYLSWLGDILVGDLGESLASGRPISELLGARLGNTFFLAAVSAALAVPIALFLGIVSVLYRERWVDKLISISTLSAISFPEFFIAYILILGLSVEFQIFPSFSRITPDMGFWNKLYAVALPALTLTLISVAHMMRMTRAAILNVISSPYIEMAILKGMTRWRIIVHHALPNALSPVINVIVLNLAFMIVGAVVIEVVFVYPGLGQLLVDSVSNRDLPVVQASVLIFASTYVMLNLLADILSIVTNPKLRNPK